MEPINKSIKASISGMNISLIFLLLCLRTLLLCSPVIWWLFFSSYILCLCYVSFTHLDCFYFLILLQNPIAFFLVNSVFNFPTLWSGYFTHYSLQIFLSSPSSSLLADDLSDITDKIKSVIGNYLTYHVVSLSLINMAIFFIRCLLLSVASFHQKWGFYGK